MTHTSSELVVDTAALYGEQEGELITKNNLIKLLEEVYKKGGEISWLSTDNDSFEWSEINENINKFLKMLKVEEFEMIDVGLFYPKSKETIYNTYKVKP